jgi:hypothetical protein
LVDIYTCDYFASENGDLRRSETIESVVEGHNEAMVSEPELRHWVPASGDVVRRGFASVRVISCHAGNRRRSNSAVLEAEKSGGCNQQNSARGEIICAREVE